MHFYINNNSFEWFYYYWYVNSQNELSCFENKSELK